MNRLIKSILVILIALVFLIGCRNSSNKAQNRGVNQGNKSECKVTIMSDKNEFGYHNWTILLSPKLEGSIENDIEYHWVLENNNDFIGFNIEDQGPVKEIINSGETVELSLFAMVEWTADAYEEFKVKLQIVEKDRGKVVAADEITIENHAGLYELKDSDE